MVMDHWSNDAIVSMYCSPLTMVMAKSIEIGTMVMVKDTMVMVSETMVMVVETMVMVTVTVMETMVTIKMRLRDWRAVSRLARLRERSPCGIPGMVINQKSQYTGL